MLSTPNPPIIQRDIIDPIDPIGIVDPIALVDVPRDIAVGWKRPTWAHHTLHEAEGHETPHGTF